MFFRNDKNWKHRQTTHFSVPTYIKKEVALVLKGWCAPDEYSYAGRADEMEQPCRLFKKENREKIDLSQYPNFSASGSIRGMKEKYYGKLALLVRDGNYIYNVSADPYIYWLLSEL